MHFIGEHLWLGKLGQFFVVFSFGTSLLAGICYFFSVRQDLNPVLEKGLSWNTIARSSFILHGLALVGIIACMFTLIYNHYFEFHYAWEHSSRALPTHFIISCFWEGQEGSFLLWGFWQVVLGSIIIWKGKTWENGIMTVLCLSQVFIGSILLGVDIFGFQIGSSPFILTRLSMTEAPIFKDPNYLINYLTDGRGLNPLLQNYWMVIHPPTLFLGFASMIIPFGYAITGLWTHRAKEWIKPALPWALFAVMVLGTGIVMGSAWAYEALNFGGFWQWDPVENASILPWIILVAGVHVMVSYKNTGQSYITALVLILSSFILVLYASYLTRSGVLQNTSVHAFTDLGMSGQLIFFVIAFIALSAFWMIYRWRELPSSPKEESTYSREFWMFIGAMVLTLSCIQVLATTSIPVVNAVLGTHLAPPIDAVGHYNKWQILFAVLVTGLSSFSQFLKYKKTNPQSFFIQLGVYVFISVLVTLGWVILTKTSQNFMFILLDFTCIFSVVSNARILGEAIGGKMKLVGSAVAHIGFALLLLGALVAASTRKVISVNTTGLNYGPSWTTKNSQENILIYKGEPYQMSNYLVTYVSDSVSEPNTYYKINYKKIDPATGNIQENFNLYPNAQINEKMGGLIASPSTRHYPLKDIYTHISEVPGTSEKENNIQDSSFTIESFEVKPGQVLPLKMGELQVESVVKNATVKDIPIDPVKNDLAVGLLLKIKSSKGDFTTEPLFLVKNNSILSIESKIDELGMKFRFTNILPEKGAFEIKVLTRKPAKRDWVIMKAMIFPYINFLWGGTLIMVIGFLLSIFRRNSELDPKWRSNFSGKINQKKSANIAEAISPA
jgi:cytochrome c-type biogenesis protein CcmF